MKLKYWVCIAVFAILALVSVNYLTLDSTTFTVEDKERITHGASSYYLVYTDKETFKNVDDWPMLKFNSSDLQGKLKRGETFTCTVNKFRVPFFSWYRNIISC